MAETKKSLLAQESLQQAFESAGVNPKHISTIQRLFIQQGLTDFSSHSIPKKALDIIDAQFTPTTSKVISRTDASDYSTTKLLVELQNGQRIESVIMRYGDVEIASFPTEERQKRLMKGHDTFKSRKRATLCVSSQVGCSMGCTFCDFANQVEKIRNVVFMGMGEPLDNYDAVISAIKSMTDTSKFGLSPCRISVSTVGVVPRIKQLSQDMPMVGLALSLHAPTQELRQQIVPTSKAWHIDRIMHVVKQFIDNQNKDIKSTNRRRHVLVEYVIIKDINDSATTAHALGKLLKDMDILLNIIPYNPTAVPYDYKPPNANVCKEFVEITRNYGLHVLYRQEMGSDISSACGQLVIESRGCDSGDIEDVGKSTGGRKKPVKKGRVIKAMTEIVENDEKSLGHWMPELLTGVALSVSAILVYRLVCKYATRS